MRSKLEEAVVRRMGRSCRDCAELPPGALELLGAAD